MTTQSERLVNPATADTPDAELGHRRAPLPAEAWLPVGSDAAVRDRPPRSGWRILWWAIFLLGVTYFVLPLIGTLAFSLRAQPFLSAYTAIFGDAEFFETLGYSFVVGLFT